MPLIWYIEDEIVRLLKVNIKLNWYSYVRYSERANEVTYWISVVLSTNRHGDRHTELVLLESSVCTYHTRG